MFNEDLNFDEITPQIASSEFDFEKYENDCRIDLAEELSPPEILISIGEHDYKGKMYPTAVMTAGEFSAITAQSKAKKSYLKSALIASYIGGNAVNYFPNIRSHRDKDYSILDFDTEQGKYYTQRTIRRVPEIVGQNYDFYYGYATRHLTSEQRLLLIDNCLKNQDRYKAPVKLVSIDGIADLVENTNDIVMSKEASDYVTRWTYEYNIHIITVIHKSGQTGKPLGHLGTYVLKKAETVINLDLEDNMVKVTNPYSRGYRFEDFYFAINNEALPYLIDENFL